MLTSVTLLGSSSGRNAGDAALMSSIMDAVDAACGTRLLYEIPTIRPQFVRDHYDSRTRPIPTLPWNLSLKMLGLPTYRSVMRTDLTLIFDAILFDRALYNPLFNFLSTLSLLLPAAKRKGKLLACYNVGAGPVNTPAGKTMLRKLCELMDFITVRDDASLQILKEIGVTNRRLAVTADAALNTTPAASDEVDAILKKAGIPPGEDILALNVNTYLNTWAKANAKPLRRSEFVTTYVAAINRVARKLDVPLLVVATQHQDVGLSREIAGRLSADHTVHLISNREVSHYAVKGVLGRVSLLFAMRLHSMILASSALTPIAGLAYQPKVHHYFELLGLPEQSLDFDSFTVDAVANHVLRAWEQKDETRKVLESRMPVLQKRANSSADLVACLHRGEDLDATFSSIMNR